MSEANQMPVDTYWPSAAMSMATALEEAKAAFLKGEVPVGAALFSEDGSLIAKAHNAREFTKLATAHAEILVINEACKILGDWRLERSILAVTAEPCFMCAGAILQARIKHVVFGVLEPKFGAVVSNARVFDIEKLNHHPTYEYGFYAEEIGELLRNFFSLRRK